MAKGTSPQDYQAGVSSQQQAKRDKVTVETKPQKSFRQSETGIFNLVTSLSTYIIVMLIIVLAGTTTFYSENKENLSWLNNDNTFNESSYQLYKSYGLDTPLNDLNGLSLNEVYRDGNLLSLPPNFNDWTSASSGGNTSVLNFYSDYFDVSVPNYHVAKFRTTFNFVKQNYYYYNWDVKGDAYSNYLHYYSGSSYKIWSYLNVGWQNLSLKYQNSAGYSSIAFYFQSVAYNGTTSTIDIKNTYILDLTVLNLENVSKEDLDFYFNEYIDLQDQANLDTFKELGSIPVSNYSTLGQVITSVVETMDAFLSGWIDFYETILSIF